MLIMDGNIGCSNFNDIFAEWVNQYNVSENIENKDTKAMRNKFNCANINSKCHFKNKTHSVEDVTPHPTEDVITIGKKMSVVDASQVLNAHKWLTASPLKRSYTGSVANISYFEIQQQKTRKKKGNETFIPYNTENSNPCQERAQIMPATKKFNVPNDIVTEKMHKVSLYSVDESVGHQIQQSICATPILGGSEKYDLSPPHYNCSGGFVKLSQNVKKCLSPISTSNPGHYLTFKADKNSISDMGPSRKSNLPMQNFDDNKLLESLYHRSDSNVMTQSGYDTLNSKCSTDKWNYHSLAELSKLSSESLLLDNQGFYLCTKKPQNIFPNSGQIFSVDSKKILRLKNITTGNLVSSYTDTESKRIKPKNWLESSLDEQLDTDSCTNNPIYAKKTLSRHNTDSMPSKLYDTNALNATINIDNNFEKISQSTLCLPRISNNNNNNNNNNINNISSSNNNGSESVNNLERRQSITTNSSDLSPSYSYINDRRYIPMIPDRFCKNNDELIVCTETNKDVTHNIQIESPKYTTVVQPATFQPYKEVTKPFEMADFYKYSTKFRQKGELYEN